MSALRGLRQEPGATCQEHGELGWAVSGQTRLCPFPQPVPSLPGLTGSPVQDSKWPCRHQPGGQVLKPQPHPTPRACVPQAAPT